MRGNQIDAVPFEVLIEAIAVIGPVTNEMFGLSLQHIEVETELDQGDFMMIRGMGTHGEGQAMAIHNREDLHAFAAFGQPHGLPAALGRGKRGIDEALAFINRSFVPQRIGQLRQDLAQHLALAPLLEPAMDRFVVGIALGQQMPLRAGVQNPEHRVQDLASGHQFAAWACVRNVFLGELVPNPVPLVITQPQHAPAL